MSVLEIKEKDLHPYLVYYAHQKFGCYSKTIDEGKSSNKQAGENEWIHPDIVSFKLLRNDFTSQVQSFYRHMNQDVAYLYSFELKREVKLSDLKKYYFQAVSNSSWANEGYLITASLDTSNKVLMNEIERLTQAFGIGVILLNLEDIDQSHVLFEAKKKSDLDFYTINKLIEQGNKDFIEFIEVVNSCLEAKNRATEMAIINQRMDKIESFKSINLKEITQDACNELGDHIVENNAALNWYTLTSQDFTSTKVKAIKIKDQIILVNYWKDALVEVAKYCQNSNPSLFKNHCFELESENITLFLEDSQIRWAKNNTYFSLIDEKTYIHTHGSVNKLLECVFKLTKLFDIPLDEILVQLKSK